MSSDNKIILQLGWSVIWSVDYCYPWLMKVTPNNGTDEMWGWNVRQHILKIINMWPDLSNVQRSTAHFKH